jgi:hypothetical protein
MTHLETFLWHWFQFKLVFVGQIEAPKTATARKEEHFQDVNRKHEIGVRQTLRSQIDVGGMTAHWRRDVVGILRSIDALHVR